MKFGLLSSILDGWSFEEVIDFAAENGFACVELACWPRGKAERRYGGVSHFDVDAVAADDAKIRYVQDYCKQKNVEISSLAYYPNTLDPDLEKRAAAIAHIMKLIDLSAALGVNMVTTFIGRDQSKTVEENLKIVSEVWPPIMRQTCARCHRKLSYAFRCRPVARRAEPHDVARALEKGVRCGRQRSAWHQFRPVALCMADA